jgi:CRISPR-associated exonuclease Cas4
LFIPEERQRFEVMLDEETRQELQAVEKEITDIVNQPSPPPVEKIKWCKTCAYAEFCWA